MEDLAGLAWPPAYRLQTIVWNVSPGGRMHVLKSLKKSILIAALLLVLAAPALSASKALADVAHVRPLCHDNSPLCTEVLDSLNYDGQYTGHDEPSVLFYSNVAGSGNSNIYRLTLPFDPPTTPKQDGTGGTFNF